MDREEARRLLDRVEALTHACDLDLLLFFARHPHAFLASESLAGFLGYDLKEIAESLDVLLGAGLLSRKQTTAHAARLYVFATEGPHGEWLPSLVRAASTRQGRQSLMEALIRRRRDKGMDGPGTHVEPGNRQTMVGDQ